jgi:hypothetical protein
MGAGRWKRGEGSKNSCKLQGASRKDEIEEGSGEREVGSRKSKTNIVKNTGKSACSCRYAISRFTFSKVVFNKGGIKWPRS